MISQNVHSVDGKEGIMGDRISIAFQNRNETSVTLFSHWGGMGFLSTAENYVTALKAKIATPYFDGTPIGRLEPNTVMVDFIRSITTGQNILVLVY